MSLETASFLVGALLVGVAVLGGGIEVKEITIPKVSSFVRAVAGCAGLVFILLGLKAGGVIPPFGPQDPNKPTGGPDNSVMQTPFMLSAVLGKTRTAREIETQIVVFLESKQVAEFTLNARSPSKSVELSVSEPGEYQYHLKGYTKWTTDPDKKIDLVGKGSIKVDSGSSFMVATDFEPSPGVEKCETYIRND